MELKKFIKLLFNKDYRWLILSGRGHYNSMEDEEYIKRKYKGTMGKTLNLDKPETFNEKLQWLKLHDRNPEYTDLVDKFRAKEVVGNIIGSQHIVPLIGSWTRGEDIPFDSLPNKCVLKCNHDQGSTIIWNREKAMDKGTIISHFNTRLKRNAYLPSREWPYKNLKPMIIAEEFLEEDIVDYKFFCFNGEPRFVNIGQLEHNPHTMHITFVDLDWNPMPFGRTDFPRVEKLPEKPAEFEEMLDIVRTLAKNTRFVRIDLFNVNHRVYFSEFTLYPTGGYIRFSPPEYDKIVGSWLDLETAK